MKLTGFLLLLFCSTAEAAITFDAATLTSDGSVSVLNFSHTVGGGCAQPVIVVDVHWTDNNAFVISSLTIGGVSATLIDTVYLFDAGNRWTATYRRIGVATGSNAIAITMSGAVSSSISAMARSYCGIDQTTPTGTPSQATGDSAGPAQSTVSSASGELVIATAQVRNETLNGTVGGQSQRYNDTDGRAGADLAGAGSVTMQFTLSASSQWGIISVPLKPYTAPAAGVRRRVVSNQ
jgi:hypothetical protein